MFLAPPPTKTPLTEKNSAGLNHVWQRWLSDLYEFLRQTTVTAVSTVSTAATDLLEHINKTGTEVHGLGTASTSDVTDFVAAGDPVLTETVADTGTLLIKDSSTSEKMYDPLSLGTGLTVDTVGGSKTLRVSVDLDEFVSLPGEVPEADTLLLKDSNPSDKSYEKLLVGEGLQITDSGGNRSLALSEECQDICYQLAAAWDLVPPPFVGRRLMSPIASPMTQGKIYNYPPYRR